MERTQDRTGQKSTAERDKKSGSEPKASDVMTGNPQSVTERDDLQKVAKLMLDHDCGAIPVVDGKKIIGMITDRDIVIRVVAKGKNPSDARVSDAMTKEAYCVRESDPLEKVYQVMSDRQVRRVPVVDQNQQLVGIIAQADVATQGNQDKRVGETVEQISEPRK